MNSELKSVIQEVEYGVINVKLDELLKKKNISTYQLNKRANIRFQTIQKLRDNSSSRIDEKSAFHFCLYINEIHFYFMLLFFFYFLI